MISPENCLCSLCLKLLCKPTTTSCGHSFCKPCLTASLRHKPKCPVCRSVLFSDPAGLLVSTDFDKLLQDVFPKE
eukprot:snap_masked-scaffold_44-processed-gene-1.40-mRNA-1 protein AED:1.00 eAED:1.00 QI:0/-1/0/0/-1/1/1/0/74